jgi:hypothetical protein
MPGMSRTRQRVGSILGVRPTTNFNIIIVGNMYNKPRLEITKNSFIQFSIFPRFT